MMFPADIMDIINEYANTPVRPSPVKMYKEMLENLVLFQRHAVWSMMIDMMRTKTDEDVECIRHFTKFHNKYPILFDENCDREKYNY